MAIFFLQISSLSRAAGRRATAAAAYRAGERLRDERSGELHNYSRRRDVLHAEIFLPGQYAQAPMTWARNRERLWNTAEHAEKRHSARVAREIQVNLPAELAPLERIQLARAFAAEMTERYKVAVDLAVHEPRPEGDPRNFHAHLLLTTREVTPAGLGAKAGLDMAPRERRQRALADHRQEFTNVRASWASLANEALARANVAARIDHRSLAAQGVAREPTPRIPIGLLMMERRGLRSEYAEHLREQYRERLAARGAAASVPAASVDLEQVRREARAAWLRLRTQAAQPVNAPEAQPPLSREEDLSR